MTGFDEWVLIMYNDNCKERMHYQLPRFERLQDYIEANKEFLEKKYQEILDAKNP